jgi:uncharacterized protein YPO0396
MADPGLLRHTHVTITDDAWMVKEKELDALRAEFEQLQSEVKQLQGEQKLFRKIVGIWKSNWDQFVDSHPESFAADREQAKEVLERLGRDKSR